MICCPELNRETKKMNKLNKLIAKFLETLALKMLMHFGLNNSTLHASIRIPIKSYF